MIKRFGVLLRFKHGKSNAPIFLFSIAEERPDENLLEDKNYSYRQHFWTD